MVSGLMAHPSFCTDTSALCCAPAFKQVLQVVPCGWALIWMGTVRMVPWGPDPARGCGWILVFLRR